MFSRVCVWATFRLGLELDQCKVYPITTKVFAGPNWYVLTSELLKLVHWKRSYVFTCPCHVEIHVAMFGPLAMSPTHLRMSQNRVYISKHRCLEDRYRGACLGLDLDRFNHSDILCDWPSTVSTALPHQIELQIRWSYHEQSYLNLITKVKTT